MRTFSVRAFFAIALAVGATAATCAQPSAEEWAALAALPDFSGVWVPDVADQRRKERNVMTYSTELPTE